MTVRPCLRGVFAFALLGTTACQDYLFEQKFPEQVKEAQIIQAAGTPTPADILFVVDNSGSMADEQALLAANFDAFINQIAGTGDYRIAVVTTDQSFGMGDRGEQQGLSINTFNMSAPFNLLEGSPDFSMCSDSNIPHSCFRGPMAGSRLIKTAELSREQQIARFRDNVQVGSCGSGTEQGLKAMIGALTLAATSTGCNEGFLRPEANLVVVIVSDEPDRDNRPINEYLTALAALKPISQTRIATIVGSVNGEVSNCRIPQNSTCGSRCQNPPAAGSGNPCRVGGPASQCPGEFCQEVAGMGNMGQCQNPERRYFLPQFCFSCSYFNDGDCCSAEGGSRYVEFAKAFETALRVADPRISDQDCRGNMDGQIGCLVDSICQSDFSGTLARIARDLVITNQYLLEPAAKNPAGVVVRVRGGRFPDGIQLEATIDFEVSPDGRVLRLISDKAPKIDENIEIFYVFE